MASNTVVEKSPTEVLKELTPAQHKTWLTTGDLPEAKATPPPEEVKAAEEKAATEKAAADKSAADKVAAAKTAEENTPEEKAAAESAGEPTEVSKNKQSKSSRIINELRAENNRLASEIETLRKAPAAAPPKGDEPTKPLRNDLDAKTGQLLYATDEAYEEARDKWIFEKASRETRKQIAKENEDLRNAEQNKLIEKRLLNSINITRERHPDFDSVLKVTTTEKGERVFGADAVKAIKAKSVLDAWILDSEIGMEILYHLAKNPSEVERIQSLGPFAAARELTKLEEKLSGATAAAPKEKAAEEAPAARPVIVPPSPAANVGGRGTGPLDEVLAATEAGDFRRFKKAADAEEHRARGAN